VLGLLDTRGVHNHLQDLLHKLLPNNREKLGVGQETRQSFLWRYNPIEKGNLSMVGPQEGGGKFDWILVLACMRPWVQSLTIYTHVHVQGKKTYFTQNLSDA
jgi:hypothetical protein